MSGSLLAPAAVPFARERASRERHPFFTAAVTTSVALAIGAMVGWVADVPQLRTIVTGAVEMKLNTAVCILSASAALLLLQRRQQRLCDWSLAPLWLFAGGSAFEYFAKVSLGIDQLLFAEPSPRTPFPGRIALFTSLALIFLGLAITAANWRSRRSLRFSQAYATIAVVITAFVLLGYLFGAPELFDLSSRTPMAVHTAASIHLLALATLASGRDGWVRVLFYSKSVAARASRGLVLAGVAGTAALGLLRMFGEQQHLFSFAYGVTIMATAQIILVSGLVAWGATIVERESSRRQAREDALHASDERYRLAIAATDDQLYDWDMRAGSGGSEEGADRDSWNERIHPDDRARVVTSFAEALESDINLWSAEYRIRDEHDRYSTVLERSYIVRDGSGRPMRAVGALSDVTRLREADAVLRNAQAALELRVAVRTRELDAANATLRREISERQRMAEELRKERDFVSALMESSGALLMVVDRSLRVVRLNRACEELTGWSAIEVEGRPFYETLVPEEDRGAVVSVARTILEGNYPNSFENNWVTRRGERRLISWKNTALHDKHGEVQFIVSSGMDITEERLTQTKLEEQRDRLSTLAEALRASNAELEAFSYSVSHDLRAPLRAMDGFSQALLEDYADLLDSTGRDYLDRIRRAAQRMSELIDGLLSLSRVSRADLQRSRVDLSEAAEEIMERLRAQSPDRAAEVTIADGLEAWGDPRLLRAVLANLLENAWKFTRNCDVSRVEIGVTESGEFFVRDNGAGFDSAFASKLFTPFQRLHSVSDFPGTGIGLATVMRIIRRHHGKARAESSPGAGATFYFTVGEAAS